MYALERFFKWFLCYNLLVAVVGGIGLAITGYDIGTFLGQYIVLIGPDHSVTIIDHEVELFEFVLLGASIGCAGKDARKREDQKHQEILNALRGSGAVEANEAVGVQVTQLAPEPRNSFSAKTVLKRIALVAIAVSALFAIVIGSAMMPGSGKTAGASQTSSASSTKGVVSPAASLAFVFQPEMLRAQIAYLESGLGPAISVDYDGKKSRRYKVEGCDVVIGSGDGKTIASLRMENISKTCDIDLSKFSAGWPRSAKLTFGEFDEQLGKGSFSADCLSGCGNASSPSVYDHYTGSHAEGFLEVVAEKQLIDDPSISASMNWEDAMKPEGKDYVTNNKFNCDRKYEEPAHMLFKQVPIQNITIGTELYDRSGSADCPR